MALDIQALAARAAAIGMNLAGNAKEEVTLHLGFAAGESYDAATDTETPGAGTNVTLQALPFKRKNTQTGAALQITERSFSANTETLLIQNADIPEGLKVTEEDTITRAGAVWAIVAVERPPGVTLIDVRKT